MKLFTLTLSIFMSVIAFGNVVPAFSCSATQGCSPLVITVTDHSAGGATSWDWDLGNGNNSTQQSPSATYVNPGTYRIRLRVSNGTSSDTMSQIITVYRKPTVDFVGSRLTACPNDSIAFSPILTTGDGPVTHFAWGFGNGMGSDSMFTSYRYRQPGLYDVTLVVLDTNGCSANITKPSYIRIWPSPTAAFTVTPDMSCGTSQLVTFTNFSQGTGITSVLDYGDSTFSTTGNGTRLYTYGKYKAILTVTNTYGCTNSLLKNIAVINLHADFTADKVVACAGEEINFTNTSPMPGSQWQWYFGDGNNSTRPNPKHIYTNPGLYTVTFVLKDGICKDSIVKVGYIRITPGFALTFVPDHSKSCTTPFVVNFTPSATTTVASYSWDFGNGDGDTSSHPTTTYNTANYFSVTLTAVDSNGCTVKVTKPGMISTVKPQVKFTGDTMACPGYAVRLVNRTVNAMRYHWDFGDGDTSAMVSPQHRYAHTGSYDVSLTAIDSIGCDSTLTKHNFVTVNTAQVDFTVGQTFSLCPPLVTTFRSIVNRNDMRLTWDFGDGYTDTMPNPTHIFFHPGVYTVRLIGASAQGCIDTMTYVNMVTVQGPTGNFSVTSNNGCVPLAVHFNGSASASTNHITCDLGNGILMNDSLNFTYTYTAPRIYHPKFILTDHVGCSIPFDVDSIIATTSPALVLRDTSICVGQSVDINLGPDHYTWTGTVCDTCGRVPNITDSTAVANLAPIVNTTYVVNAINAGGCTSTGQFHINVKQMEMLPPRAPISICQNETIGLSTTIGDSIIWSPATYLNSTTAAAPLCTPGESVTYNVLAYNKVGCATSQDISVNVRHMDTLPARVAITLCQTEEANLGLIAGDTIIWSPSTFLNDPSSASPTCHPLVPVTYTVVANNKVGCSTIQQIPVNVIVKVKVALTGDSAVCPGGQVHMSVAAIDTSTQGVNYSWSPASFLDNSHAPNVSAQMQDQTQTFTVVTHSGGCAPDTSRVTILVHSAASVKLPSTITTVTMAEVPLRIVSGDLTTYQWTAPGTLSCSDCKSPILTPGETQMVRITGTDQYGCVASDSMMINVLQCDPESIFVPNTFTPNGDGLHDVLYIHSRTLSQLDAFRVYDRWGAMVFETRDLGSGWDGMINGTAAPQGVYLFTVKGKCDNGYDVEKNGTITLVR